MVYLYGASGHAKVIIEILEQQNIVVKGLVDTNPKLLSLLSYPVYNDIEKINFTGSEQVIIAIGKNATRKALAEKCNLKFASAIHKSANISKRSRIQEGTVVMAGVSINCDASIGKHVILNTGSVIEHDCIVEDYVHISPNAALAGNVWVGEGTHIGIGASIIQGIKIGKWATIGAGSVIINDVPDNATIVGNPGKVIKYNLDKL